MNAALATNMRGDVNGRQDRNAQLVRLMIRVSSARDRQAFESLFRFYAPRVKSFMMRKGADEQMAEELAQETMLRVWRKAEFYQPSKSAVSSWIFTIARNLRIDRLRRESIRHFDDLADYDAADTAPASDEIAYRQQQKARIEASLRALPDDQTMVMRLAFIDDLSQREIADRLGLPLGTVKSRMRLAYGKLRIALEGEL